MMRPYMLWLAMLYGGRSPSDMAKVGKYAESLQDWFSYQTELRMLGAWS